jgi:hypothetical protein
LTVLLGVEAAVLGLSGVRVAVAEGAALVEGLAVALLEVAEEGLLAEELAGRVLGDVVVVEVAGLVVVVVGLVVVVVVVALDVVGRELFGVTWRELLLLGVFDVAGVREVELCCAF